MNDTIASKFDEVPLRPGLVLDPDQFCDLNGLTGWRYDLGRPQQRQGQTCRRFRILAPLGPGPRPRELTIFGHADVIDGYKVSLPAVVHGSNLHLIASQAEIDQALHIVAGLINRVAEFDPHTAEIYFTRVDLVLQVAPPGIPPAAFFAPLQNCRSPRIRSASLDYYVRGRPSGLVLKGGEAKIRAYDKILKHRGRPGNVTRIEIELHGGILRELLGTPDGGYPTRLDFGRCYRVYRDLVLQLEPEPIRHLTLDEGFRSPKDYAAFLAAVMENEGRTLPGGIRPLELYQQQFSVPAFNDFRRKVTAAQFNLNEISFAELLPEQWPARHLVFNAEETIQPQHRPNQ